MRLHQSVITKLLNIYANYGGFSNETKLREQLDRLDFTVYERKGGNQEMLMVLTEDYHKALSGNQ